MTLAEIKFRQTIFTEASRAPQNRAVEPAGSCFVLPTCVPMGHCTNCVTYGSHLVLLATHYRTPQME